MGRLFSFFGAAVGEAGLGVANRKHNALYYMLIEVRLLRDPPRVECSVERHVLDAAPCLSAAPRQEWNN